MDKDTFTAGVVPGGLTDHTEIKILICHILDRTGNLCHEDVLTALSAGGYANYFEVADALSDLLSVGHIEQSGELYLLRDAGREIARVLADDVPFTVRERALADVAKLARRTHNQNFYRAKITGQGNAFHIRCSVSDSLGKETFAIEMEALSQSAAQRIRENFIDNAEAIMRFCLSHLSGEEL